MYLSHIPLFLILQAFKELLIFFTSGILTIVKGIFFSKLCRFISVKKKFQGEVVDYFLVEPDRALFFPSVDYIRTALSTKTAPPKSSTKSKKKFEIQVKTKEILVRSTTISVVELQGNSDSGRERLRLPTASLTIVFSGGMSLSCYHYSNFWT